MSWGVKETWQLDSEYTKNTLISKKVREEILKDRIRKLEDKISRVTEENNLLKTMIKKENDK